MNFRNSILILGLILPYCLLSNEKLLIITHNYSQPAFIDLQYRSFKKFLIDDFEYVVFNDATDHNIARTIDSMCISIGIQCYKVPQKNRTRANLKLDLNRGIFWAAARHAEAIHYSMDIVAFKHPGLVMMIDSDMLLIKQFSVATFMQDYDIAGLRQVRDEKIRYLWAGLMFFRMDKLPHKNSMQFKNGLIDGTYVDSGGFLHYYFQENPQLKILCFDQEYRHFIDENWSNYIFPSHFNGNNFQTWPQYLQCKNCKSTKKTCPHNTRILKELNFDATIIQAIRAKKFPPKVEFILKDTFLHYQDGSNYANQSPKFIKQKKELLFNFMTDILNCHDKK